VNSVAAGKKETCVDKFSLKDKSGSTDNKIPECYVNDYKPLTSLRQLQPISLLT